MRQGPDGIRQPAPFRRRVRRGPVPEVRVPGPEPAGPAWRRRRAAATGTMLRKAGIPSLRMPPLIQPWMPAIRRALRSQKTVSSPKPARKNSADHLVPTARPRQTPGGEAPPADAQPGPGGQLEQAGGVRRRGRGLPSEPGGEPAPAVVAVHQQGAERGKDPEHQEDVQQRGPGHHQVVAVHGQQDARHGAQGQRAEELLGDQGQQEDGQRACQGRTEPPAEGVVRAEKPHAGGDHPFARPAGGPRTRGVSSSTSGFPAMKDSLALSGQLRS